MRQAHSKSNKGFTLIEIAIVLVIVTLMVSGSILTYAHFSNKYKIEQTQAKMDKILDALSVYAQQNNRLPCPADPAATTVKVGSELLSTTGTKFGKCFNSSANNSYIDSTGIVPWRDLGLKQDDVVDAWGRYYTYKPAPYLTVDMTDANQRDVTPIGVATPPVDDPTPTRDPKYNNTERDLHRACRNTLWYGADGKHVDRAKAMFCCNAPPKASYLADTLNNSINTSKGATIANWNQSTLMISQEVGQLNAAAAATSKVTSLQDLPIANVALSNQWLDGPDGRDAYGDFNEPYGTYVGEKSVSMRAASSAIAVTLLSHGPNGKLAFILGKPKTTRVLGTFDAQGSYNRGTSYGASRPAELEVLDTLQISAGMAFNPKTAAGLINRTGLKENSSDDITTYLRTDQLISKIGSNSCVRTANIQPENPPAPLPPVTAAPPVPHPGPGKCYRAVPKIFSYDQSGTYCQASSDKLGNECGILTASARTQTKRYKNTDILNFGVQGMDPVKARCVSGIFQTAGDGCTTLWTDNTAGVRGGCNVCGYEFVETTDCTAVGQCSANSMPGNNTQVITAPTGNALCAVGDPVNQSAPTTILTGAPYFNSTLNRWEWQCIGSGGSSSQCWIKRRPPDTATCGPYANKDYWSDPLGVDHKMPGHPASYTSGAMGVWAPSEANLCDTGFSSSFRYLDPPGGNTRTYEWYCQVRATDGTPGIPLKCTAKIHDRVPGVCRTSASGSFGGHTKLSFAAPSSPSIGCTNTGATWNASDPSFDSATQRWSWTCLGSYEGADASCWAQKKNHATNGACNMAVAGTTISSPPVGNAGCSAGTQSSVSLVGSTYSWTCNGVDEDVTDSEFPVNPTCTANKTPTPVPGHCGTMDGNNGLSARPANGDPNLCSAGTATAVIPANDIGPWGWTCQGVSGGGDAVCGASHATQNGSCKPYLSPPYGAQPASDTATGCLTGYYIDASDDPTNFKWTCHGYGASSTDAPCTAAK